MHTTARHVLKCAISFLTLLLTLVSAKPAGVTLITHGFRSDVSTWIIPMAEALNNYPRLILTNTTCYEMYFEITTSGYVLKQRKLAGDDPTSANSGEILIKLDWSELAGDFLNILFPLQFRTTDVAPAVVAKLISPNFIPELKGVPLVALPLHLIGHSRGGSLVCEIARLLGEQGIWVDHVTTLDPHPLNNAFNDALLTDLVDGPAVAWSNVLFADNYYQPDNSLFDPGGQFVPGAYNRRLNVSTGGYASHHSNVHLWYHGTIDWKTPTADTQGTIGGFERTNWWTTAETQGRTTGEYFSLLGGGDRLSTNTPIGDSNPIREGFNQLYDVGAGAKDGSRMLLTTNSGIWPSLITFNLLDDIRATNSFQVKHLVAGDQLSVQLRYQAGKQLTNLSIAVLVDRDFNPNNGNETQIDSVSVPPSGTTVVFKGTRKLATDNVAPLTYAVFATITDGSHTRYLYAPELLIVQPSSQSPTLTQPIVTSDGMRFDVIGRAGQKVVVQQSTSLPLWQPRATNTLSNVPWTLVEPIGPGTRFFRAVLGD